MTIDMANGSRQGAKDLWKYALVIALACVAAVAGSVWYESQHPTNASPSSANYWVIYTLTPSGNHTQIQIVYYNGNNYTYQINWLDFANKTAVYNYFKCTPSMKGCTLDGCSFTVLVNTATEYQVRTGEPCGA